MTAVTETGMTSDRTPHTARRVRPEALTAMLLAEICAPRIAAGDLQHGDRAWQRIDRLASELDLTGPAALVRIAEPPHELRRLHVLATTCWCGPDGALDGHHDDGPVEFAATCDDPIDREGHLLDELVR